MKGLIPERTGLVDFVFKVVTQRHFDEDEIFDAIEKAENEMLLNGIVAVGDICNNNLTLRQKLRRNIDYYNFVEVSGWLPEIAETRFSRSKGYYDHFVTTLPNTSLVPHAPYSVSNELWRILSSFCTNKVVSIHNQETAFEDELFLQGTGDLTRMYDLMNIDNSFYQPSKKSSLQTYFEKLRNAASVILVHNTFTGQDDVDYAIQQASKQEQLLSFCLCLNANLYIENALPPVEMLVNNNCNLVIGTDSLASNRSLSVLDELKSIHNHFPAIQLSELLTWATVNGAKALKMEERLGSFEKGKQPGVVLLEGVNEGKLTKQSTAKRII
jgi:cytosine/adenosine deaminase-related metal-dependent hydrolase